MTHPDTAFQSIQHSEDPTAQ